MKRLRPFVILAALLATTAFAQLIDINTASQQEIESLPGIGEKMAQEIINHRPYGSAQELLQIPRFGEKRLSQIRDLITVSAGDAPGQGEDADEDTAPAPKPQAAANAADDWKPPAGMRKHQCWRCREYFCVEEGTTSGVCPYCGIRWALAGAKP